MNEAETLAAVCRLLTEGGDESAHGLLATQLPFTPIASVERKYTTVQAVGVFRRDGFVCRYSGKRLVFPGTLRLLSVLMPELFPYQPNWKLSETHMAYWLLYPTVDHIVPVTRGGRDEEANWVTTSQLRNSAKSNWLLEELGWQLALPGDLTEWDGLCGWFTDFLEAHPQVLQYSGVKRWRDALRRAA